MLAYKMALGIISIVLLFIANRVHFGYNCGLRTIADFGLDTLGIISGIAFCTMLAWENQTLYVVPQIAFFISACMLVRHKTRKKFCLPFWRTARFAILAFVIFGGIGYALEILELLQNEVDTLTVVCIVATFAFGIIILVVLTNYVFNHILLNRRRVMNYYY